MAWTSKYTAAFTGTQYTSLPSWDATWVNDYGTMRIGTGGATLGSAGESRSHITTALANDQASQIKMLDSAAGQGVTARASAGSASYWGWTGYVAAWENDTTVRIIRANGSSGTSLGSASVTLSSGDVLRLECVGTSIKLFVNGVEKVSVTDSNYGSGYAGLYAGSTLDAWGDDFAAEEDAGGGSSVSPSSGTITLTGAAPLAKVDHYATPTAGAVTFTGSAPNVAVTVLIAPSRGAVTFAGNAPTVVAPVTVSPQTGTVTFAGAAPSAVLSGQAVLTPSTGTVTFTGATPTVFVAHTRAPVAGAVVLAGAAPTVQVTVLATPTAGAVVFTGATPTVFVAHVRAPSAGTVVLSGAAPTAVNSGDFTAPASETWRVPYENRTWRIPYENRTWRVR